MGRARSPPATRTLLRDGDTDPTKGGDSNYAGCYFLNAKANADHPPKIIDARCNPVMDRDEVYSGCYANVKVSIYAYNNPKGGKGISAGLVAIQKTKGMARAWAATVEETDSVDNRFGATKFSHGCYRTYIIARKQGFLV